METRDCGTGECRAHSVASACVGGREILCAPASPQAERCDGLDNDRDGVVDNGDPDANLPCDTVQLGACVMGTTACEQDAVTCNAEVEPADVDNDCDGEGFCQRVRRSEPRSR